MDIANLLKELPLMESEFELDLKGNITGLQYKGAFKYKLPNIAKNSQISVMEARLNSGLAETLDPTTRLVHYMLSYLRFTLEEKTLPEWWKKSNYGVDLYDPNVVTELYQKCTAFEKEWELKVHGEQE